MFLYISLENLVLPSSRIPNAGVLASRLLRHVLVWSQDVRVFPHDLLLRDTGPIVMSIVPVTGSIVLFW